MAQAGTRADPTAEIAQIRTALFADLAIAPTANGAMAGPGIANVKAFASIPFVALIVDPAALDRLLGHPLVVSVAEDTGSAADMTGALTRVCDRARRGAGPGASVP